jgi:RNA polymerase sigma factor (TIGR02999 family)
MSVASNPHELTQLLLAWNNGDPTAFDRIVPIVHTELRRLATNYMRRERPGHTLQTTALINEAYMRLVDTQKVPWKDRSHFFGIAAGIMRRILVDFARSRNFQKRGGQASHLQLDGEVGITPAPDENLVALDEALTALAKVNERMARVVELRFFGGLQEVEIASSLGVSPRTVREDWRLAKAWLLRRLTEGVPDEQ